MTIWNILWPFGIIYGRLVSFVVIWHILSILVCLDQEKSGNPGVFTHSFWGDASRLQLSSFFFLILKSELQFDTFCVLSQISTLVQAVFFAIKAPLPA
jgi:hypothetical protein